MHITQENKTEAQISILIRPYFWGYDSTPSCYCWFAQQKHTKIQQLNKRPSLNFKLYNSLSVNYTVVTHILLQIPSTIDMHFKQHIFLTCSISLFWKPLQSIVMMVTTAKHLLLNVSYLNVNLKKEKLCSCLLSQYIPTKLFIVYR